MTSLSNKINEDARKAELDRAVKYVEEKLPELPPEAKRAASGLRDWGAPRRTAFQWSDLDKFTRNVFRRLQTKYPQIFGNKATETAEVVETAKVDAPVAETPVAALPQDTVAEPEPTPIAPSKQPAPSSEKTYNARYGR